MFKVMWAVTNHAVDQFINRWETNKGVKEAKEELLELLSTSVRQAERSATGDPIYVSPSRPEIRLVVKDGDVCVTVLSPGNQRAVLQVEEENDILEYLQEKGEENKQKADQEIADLEAKIREVDLERKALGDKKNKLGNALFQARANRRALDYL